MTYGIYTYGNPVLREKRQCVSVAADGFAARAIQHEMDHLNGVIFVDHISHVKKIALSGRLKQLSKSTKEELGIL